MSDWEVVSLSDKRISTEIRSGFACGEKDIEGGAAHLRMNNISVNGSLDFSLVRRIPKSIADKRKLWLQKDDILFCNTNSTALVGKTCLFSGWQEKCTFSNHLTKIRCNTEHIVPAWLALYLQQLWSNGYFAVNCKEFVGQSSFSNDKLKGIDVPIPPIYEQRRIVARIEELSRRAEEARKLRQEAVAQIATQFFHIRRNIYQSLLSDFPVKPLGKCGKVMGGGTPSKKRDDYWHGDIPWVAPKEMKTFRITASSEQITETAISESSAKLIPAGSVLFVVRGMILARYVPVAVSEVPCAINQDMKAIVPAKGIAADYLAHMLWGANDILQGMVETAGHGTKKLETQAWSNLEIPIPDTEKQKAVIDELTIFQERLAELELLQRETAQELEQFQSALLAKAFRGEL
jgi:type I restriction enzyme S subunit